MRHLHQQEEQARKFMYFASHVMLLTWLKYQYINKVPTFSHDRAYFRDISFF